MDAWPGHVPCRSPDRLGAGEAPGGPDQEDPVQDSSDTEPGQTSPQKPDGIRGSIVIAEDDAEMRRLLVGAFRRHGYGVIEMRDGVQLAEFLADLVLGEPWAVSPDAIVSDIRMPGFSGLDVLHELSLARWAPPVILITAFGDAAVRDEAKRLGAAALVEKPLDLDDLRETVESLIAA